MFTEEFQQQNSSESKQIVHKIQIKSPERECSEARRNNMINGCSMLYRISNVVLGATNSSQNAGNIFSLFI